MPCKNSSQDSSEHIQIVVGSLIPVGSNDISEERAGHSKVYSRHRETQGKSASSNNKIQPPTINALECDEYMETRWELKDRGALKWPGKQIHSMNYRIPKPFSNQVVIIIGSSASALDISLELKMVAKEVHMSVRSPYAKDEKDANFHVDLQRLNVHLHPVVACLDEDGTVVFEDGFTVIADSIIYCTGYSYSIPFLDTKGIVTVENKHVGPLYEHIFPPLLAPSLSFVGIPSKIIPFPFYELQSKWIASILARKVKLPSRRDMIKLVKDLYDYHLHTDDISKRHLHDIGNFEYCDQLADLSGAARFEEWRKDNAIKTIKFICSNPVMFRDMGDKGYLSELLERPPPITID